MKDNQEKTTLGDISALSDLKNKMDGKYRQLLGKLLTVYNIFNTIAIISFV